MTTSKDDPMYSEFPDADLSRWPYVASKAADMEIRKLATKHKLCSASNMGGYEFYRNCDVFHCQISGIDDVADLNKLRKALGGWEGIAQSMRDRLAWALADYLDGESARSGCADPYVSVHGIKDVCLDGYFDLTKMVDAILSEMERPSDEMQACGRDELSK